MTVSQKSPNDEPVQLVGAHVVHDLLVVLEEGLRGFHVGVFAAVFLQACDAQLPVCAVVPRPKDSVFEGRILQHRRGRNPRGRGLSF